MKTFEMSEAACAAAKTWLVEHMKTCRNWKPKTEGLFAGQVYHGAIGGAVSYVFTPTSIGLLINIQCACGAQHLCNDDEL